jgi:uncharacterized protein (TIGR00251 family)
MKHRRSNGVEYAGEIEMTRSDPPGVVGEWDGLTLNERSGGVRFSVHVRPRSSRSAILGVRVGELEVALTSPPADGAANSELVGLLAKALDVRRANVAIVVGTSSRDKVIEVNGLGPDEARLRLSRAKR